MEAIDDNGFVSNYWYDAAGERTVKTSGESQQMYVNSVFSGGDTQTANFTAYVNAYLVVSKGGQYTKHIYIGSQRIVSKLGDLDSYGSDPRRIEYAGANVDGAKVDYKTKYTALQQTIKDNYAKFEVPYYGKDNDDYVNGQGFCCDDTPNLKSFNPSQNDNPELFQYYYHSDHLGSSSLITNLDGETVQHIEYVPFGEVFIEERNNTWNTPYLFNAKELDEETGLYYYGARYYDPRTSIWLSTDPLQEKHPNFSTYAYAALNPVKFIDPTGEDWIKNNKTQDVEWRNEVIDKKTTPHGWSYIGQEYNGIRILRYQPTKIGDRSSLEIEVGYNSGNTEVFNWTQTLSTNAPRAGTNDKPIKVDVGDSKAEQDNFPFYYTKKEMDAARNTSGYDVTFYDKPSRTRTTDVIWEAELSPVSIVAKSVDNKSVDPRTTTEGKNVYARSFTLKYGFKTQGNSITAFPVKIVQPSKFHEETILNGSSY